MKEKKYEVVGDSLIFGYSFGQVFTRAIPRPQEKRLIKRGHIRVVEGGPAKPPAPKSDEQKSSLLGGGLGLFGSSGASGAGSASADDDKSEPANKGGN